MKIIALIVKKSNFNSDVIYYIPVDKAKIPDNQFITLPENCEFENVCYIKALSGGRMMVDFFDPDYPCKMYNVNEMTHAAKPILNYNQAPNRRIIYYPNSIIQIQYVYEKNENPKIS